MSHLSKKRSLGGLCSTNQLKALILLAYYYFTESNMVGKNVPKCRIFLPWEILVLSAGIISIKIAVFAIFVCKALWYYFLAVLAKV